MSLALSQLMPVQGMDLQDMMRDLTESMRAAKTDSEARRSTGLLLRDGKLSWLLRSLGLVFLCACALR